MTLTENENLQSPMFDRAMELRDNGQLEESVELLEQLLQKLGPRGQTPIGALA